MKKRIEKEVKKGLKTLVLCVILFLILVVFILQFYKSLFFQKPERINLLFFNQNPTLISLSTIGESNYYINLYPDLKLNVPGGYGDYRIGALIKLSQIEKDNELINRAIGSSTLTFLNFYFYPNEDQTYFGKAPEPEFNLNLKNIIFNKSNASLFNKVFLFFKLVGIQNHNFIKLNAFEKLNNNKDLVFDTERFAEEYNGLFFQHTYRDERKSVQILYTNDYNSADRIAKILENNGIRVVDISKTNKTDKNCKVYEKTKKYSMTSKNVSNYLNCKLVNGDTEISDIKIFLGDQEELWK